MITCSHKGEDFQLASYPLGLELTKKLLEISAVYHEGAGGCHDLDHCHRVCNTALYIGSKMAADLKIISASAILHDIGREFETRQQGKICHAEKGAELAEKILAGLQFTPEEIAAITHCIRTHRYRNSHIPVSLEAKILFDADKLDSIGATGIGRAFLFAGRIGARLHNPGSDIDGTSSYSHDDTAYREYRIKMCKIKDKMLTTVGKSLAQQRHQFMEKFFSRLELEVQGEYLEQSLF